MRVLITGGYGFIGSHVAERFHREGHQIYILDNLSSGKQGNISFRHRSYLMDAKDSKCEEVFAGNRFDLVIHLAGATDPQAGVEHPMTDALENILSLVNMLDLSRRYGVKKLIYASTEAVYGKSAELLLEESLACIPDTAYGLSKLTGEQYCKLWQQLYGFEAVSLRFSKVYGPRQTDKSEGGVVYRLLSQWPAADVSTQETGGDFIYVDDVADAVYRTSSYTSSPLLNVSSSAATSVPKLVSILGGLLGSQKVEELQPDDTASGSVLDHRKAVRELNWFTKYSVEAGLGKTVDWWKKNASEAHSGRPVTVREKTKLRTVFGAAYPYIENLLIFLLVLFLSWFMKDNGINLDVDFKLIYIIAIGIHYGLRQATIAILLSCGLFLWEIQSVGHSLLTLVYNMDTLVHFSLYIFIGSVLGYSTDNRTHRVLEKDGEIKEVRDKFNFLYDLYEESKQVRRELQEQIRGSDDSFGKIYSMVERLNSLSPGKVLDEAVGLFEEIFRSREVYLFSVAGEGHYLRTLSRSRATELDIPKSMRIPEHSSYWKALKTSGVIVNRDFSNKEPLFLAPISVEGRVICLVAIYTLSFDALTLYRKNLFEIVVRLINSVLARAHQYDQAIRHRKFLDDTDVLLNESFMLLMEEKRMSKDRMESDFVLLRILDTDWKARDIHERILDRIREHDAVGIDEDGRLLLLLANTSIEESSYVMARLSAEGIKTELIA